MSMNSSPSRSRDSLRVVKTIPSSISSKSFTNSSSTITPLRSFLTCLLYGCTSICITFFNKAIFSVYGFRFPCFVTFLQIVVCLFLLCFSSLMGLIQLPKIDSSIIMIVFPLSACWWGYVVSGIAALRFLNIPMFATLRKCTALIVLILETMILKKSSSLSIWFSILIMVLGGLIAGLYDLAFNLIGYILVTICCIMTALYLVLIVEITKKSKLDTFGLLFYNNLLALPLIILYMISFTNEIKQVIEYQFITDFKFWMFLLFSAAQATILNFAIFLCTKLNSPLATTVTGQMKDFVTVALGLFLFGDVHMNRVNLIGMGISLTGSLLYSRIKLLAAYKQVKRDDNGR